VRHGIPVVYFPLAPYTRAGRSREDYDADLAAIVQTFNVSWVVMAGWMHVLSDALLSRFPSRVINLHPALPGTFPGTDAIERAYKAYQRGEIDHTGVMVHLVPGEAVDAGPVVAQEVVPIDPQDSLDQLEARIHAVEHRLLVGAVRQLLSPGA
jgi:formyltetrahydrofolate-dependent phosphoribosylglycinamide formyltransferase